MNYYLFLLLRGLPKKLFLSINNFLTFSLSRLQVTEKKRNCAEL